MYTPHTVTLYNAPERDETSGRKHNITILDGVFLELSQASSAQKNGMEGVASAALFIPFSIGAVNGITGQKQKFLSPKEYARITDKSGFWTLRDSGSRSAVDCFFVKGKVVEDTSFQEVKNHHDHVFRVISVDTLDFGSPDMQHWEVGGK